VIELRFHHELYDGFAVDEAVKVYGRFALMEQVREPFGFVVRLCASEAAKARGFDDRAIAAELMNYALGKTIERHLSGEMEEGRGALP
jgi:hypothetical protein